ncbi:hypothetical protein ACIHFD_54330 [Nonomuraea sp. NPDC051941]|uniref:hypothetical protein n=1 Tax=Nonomuraea sp. NPDC051941 TaxID=3364373 RepID=UPI0037CB637F
MTEEQVLAGRYRLTDRLGDTGIWRARDELLRREVAVTPARGTSEEDVAAEFAAAGQAVQSRAVALTAVHDLVVEGGTPWLVMRLDLRRRRRRKLVVAAACASAVAVTAATLAVVNSRPRHVMAPVQACGLLTVKDIQTLVAQPRTTPFTSNPPDPAVSQCRIMTGDAALKAGQNPLVYVWAKWHGSDEDQAVREFARRRQKLESLRERFLPVDPAGRLVTPVSGLGDEAVLFAGLGKGLGGRYLLYSNVVYRLDTVVVSVDYTLQDVTQQAEVLGPLNERLIELARRSVEGLE